MKIAGVNKSLYGHSDYFGALDGFRGVLALAVAIYHTIWLTHPNQWEFFNNGPVIIDLFFGFSGFLMYHLYASKIHDFDSGKTFMKRRLARIYPLHFFMTFVLLAYAIFRIFAHHIGLSVHEAGEVLPFQPGAAENIWSLISNFALLHAAGTTQALTFNAPSWTVGAEFLVYITFAIMMIFAPPRKIWHFGLIALGIVLIYAGLSQIRPNMDVTYDLGVFRCWAGFMCGVLAARVYPVLLPKFKAWIGSGKTAWLTFIEAVVLSVSVLFVIYCGGKLQFLVGPVIFMFILFFAFDGGMISKFMRARPFAYLAKISYSVYLNHFVISSFFAIVAERLLAGYIGRDPSANAWNGDLLLIVYLIAVVIFSHFTYKFVEVPGGKWIKNSKFLVKPRVKVNPV